MHAQLIIPPYLNYISRNMQTNYFNFKMLLFISTLIYREVLQFQTKYIVRYYLTARRSSLKRHALASSHILLLLTPRTSMRATNVFILNMRTVDFPLQDKLQS